MHRAPVRKGFRDEFSKDSTPLKVARFCMRAEKRPLIPRSAARTRDHTPRNGACETGALSISQATAKANRFKRDGSTHSRFQCPVFSLWLCQGGVRTRRSGLFPFLRGCSLLWVPEISRRTRSISTPRRCLRVGLMQRDAQRRQSTLFAFASSPRKLNQSDRPMAKRPTRRAVSGRPCARDVISDARTAPWSVDIRSPRSSLPGSHDGAGRAPHARALARVPARELRVHSRSPTARRLHSLRESCPAHFPRVRARM